MSRHRRILTEAAHFEQGPETSGQPNDLTAIDFPDRIDFGRMAINMKVSSTCPLAYSVQGKPRQWTIVQPCNRAFSISPMSGMMHAEGVTAVTITYSPSQLITDHCDVQVQSSLSQCLPRIVWAEMFPPAQATTAAHGESRQILGVALGAELSAD